MQINKNIFRSYDIRGIAIGDEIDITEEAALHIGKAVGSFLVRLGRKDMACGRDGRLTSDALQKSFIDGVLSTGLNVHNIGLTPSPMLYFAVCLDEYDCGVNVTASHNPMEYNGFKVVDDWAHSIYGDDLQEIYEMTVSQEYELGEGQYFEDDVWSRYKDRLHSMVEIKGNVKVCVDSGNGVTGPFVEELFDLPGVELVPMFTEVDGNFPHHIANPEKAENLVEMSAKIKEVGADFGIGFDGDGDRVGVLDENGEHYTCDLLLMLLARDALSRNPGRHVIFDIKSSKVVENDIDAHGGVAVRSKTGHSHIETAMKETDAILGGEISGHMFFAEDYYGYDDAFLAALKILAMVANFDGKFSEMFGGLPSVFNTPEIRLTCDDNVKFDLIHDLTEKFQDMDYDVLTVDGAFVEFNENSWGCVRASNTAPQITLRFEADSDDYLKEIIGIFVEAMSEYDYLDLSKLRSLLG